MTLALKEPSAAADIVEVADFLELKVLQAADLNSSVTDLVRALEIAATAETLTIGPGNDDGLADPDDDETLVDPGGEILEWLGTSAAAEFERREIACGGAYPFEIDAHGVLSAKADVWTSPYLFMLLVSRFGGTPKKDRARVSTIDATQVFEDLAGVAAAEYFGWDAEHTLGYPFGSPRRVAPRGFKDAIDDLCQQMGEGVGSKPTLNRRSKKDGGLDIVVVRRFPDRRPGQMMGFGQCATGGDWRDKLTELQPESFAKLWFLDPLAVTPVRMFFVPHTIQEDLWPETTSYAGVVFDRCRMAFHATQPDDEELCTQMGTWTDTVLKTLVRT